MATAWRQQKSHEYTTFLQKEEAVLDGLLSLGEGWEIPIPPSNSSSLQVDMRLAECQTLTCRRRRL